MFCDAYGQEHAQAHADARIVSLVPSVTELLFALDLGPQVVGRTGFCIHPRGLVKNVPKLGGTKDVDIAALVALAPTHVIVNIDENTLPLFEALRAQVPHVVVTHPNSPQDNTVLYELLGGIFNRATQARALVQAFERALERINVAARALPQRKVVYLIWREPWMTVSSDTYIARMLALVNWQIEQAAADTRYPTLDAQELAGTEADLVLLSSEPYPFRDKHIGEVSELCVNATQVQLVDGEMLSWYGSRAIEGLEYLGQLAHALVEQAA
jgi:ABC-type Fe3+-hydroxamate transport system substrate-binding protein